MLQHLAVPFILDIGETLVMFIYLELYYQTTLLNALFDILIEVYQLKTILSNILFIIHVN